MSQQTGSNAIRLTQPAAGQTTTVRIDADNMRLALGFQPDPNAVEKNGQNLEFSFEDGAKLVLEGYYDHFANKTLPVMVTEGGDELPGEDFLASLREDLLTAAGPGAGAGAAGSGAGEYTDDSGALIDGISRLGSLGTIYWDRVTEVPEEYRGAEERPGGTGSFVVESTVDGIVYAGLFEDAMADQHRGDQTLTFGELIFTFVGTGTTVVDMAHLTGFPVGTKIYFGDPHDPNTPFVEITAAGQVVDIPGAQFPQYGGAGVFLAPPADSDADFTVTSTLDIRATSNNSIDYGVAGPTFVVIVDAVADKPGFGLYNDDIQAEFEHTEIEGAIKVSETEDEQSNQGFNQGWAVDSFHKHDEISTEQQRGDASDVSVTVPFKTTITFSDYSDGSEQHYALVQIPNEGTWSGNIVSPENMGEPTRITLYYDANTGACLGEVEPASGEYFSRDFLQFEVSNEYLAANGGVVNLEMEFTSSDTNLLDDTTFWLDTGAKAAETTLSGDELRTDNNVSYTMASEHREYNPEEGFMGLPNFTIDTVDSRFEIRVGWASEGNNDAKFIAPGTESHEYHLSTGTDDPAWHSATQTNEQENIGAPIIINISGGVSETVTSVTFTFDSSRGSLIVNGAPVSTTGTGEISITLNASDYAPADFTTLLATQGFIVFQPESDPLKAASYDDTDVALQYSVTVEADSGASAIFSGSTVVIIDAVADAAAIETAVDEGTNEAGEFVVKGSGTVEEAEANRPNLETGWETDTFAAELSAAEATMTVKVTATFNDVDGSENHYVMIQQLPDGLFFAEGTLEDAGLVNSGRTYELDNGDGTVTTFILYEVQDVEGKQIKDFSADLEIVIDARDNPTGQDDPVSTIKTGTYVEEKAAESADLANGNQADGEGAPGYDKANNTAIVINEDVITIRHDIINSGLQLKFGWASEDNNDSQHWGLENNSGAGSYDTNAETKMDSHSDLGAPIRIGLTGETDGSTESIDSVTLSFNSDCGQIRIDGTLCSLTQNTDTGKWEITIDGGDLGAVYFVPTDLNSHADVEMSYSVKVNNEAGSEVTFTGTGTIVLDAAADKPTNNTLADDDKVVTAGSEELATISGTVTFPDIAGVGAGGERNYILFNVYEAVSDGWNMPEGPHLLSQNQVYKYFEDVSGAPNDGTPGSALNTGGALSPVSGTSTTPEYLLLEIVSDDEGGWKLVDAETGIQIPNSSVSLVDGVFSYSLGIGAPADLDTATDSARVWTTPFTVVDKDSIDTEYDYGNNLAWGESKEVVIDAALDNPFSTQSHVVDESWLAGGTKNPDGLLIDGSNYPKELLASGSQTLTEGQLRNLIIDSDQKLTGQDAIENMQPGGTYTLQTAHGTLTVTVSEADAEGKFEVSYEYRLTDNYDRHEDNEHSVTEDGGVYIGLPESDGNSNPDDKAVNHWDEQQENVDNFTFSIGENTQTVSITIEDDGLTTPVQNPQDMQMTVQPQDYNLVLCLDMSGSMLYPRDYTSTDSMTRPNPAQFEAGTSTWMDSDGKVHSWTYEDTRLYATQVALLEMLEAYKLEVGSQGTLDINLILFSSGTSSNSGTYQFTSNGSTTLTVAEAINYISNLAHPVVVTLENGKAEVTYDDAGRQWTGYENFNLWGNTDWSSALNLCQGFVNDSIVADEASRFYFISDGYPNTNNGANAYDTWKTFLKTLSDETSFELHAVGINGLKDADFLNKVLSDIDGAIHGELHQIPSEAGLDSFIDTLLGTLSDFTGYIVLPTAADGVIKQAYASKEDAEKDSTSDFDKAFVQKVTVVLMNADGTETTLGFKELVGVDANGFPGAVTDQTTGRIVTEYGIFIFHADGQYDFIANASYNAILDPTKIRFDIVFMDADGDTNRGTLDFTINPPVVEPVIVELNNLAVAESEMGIGSGQELDYVPKGTTDTANGQITVKNMDPRLTLDEVTFSWGTEEGQSQTVTKAGDIITIEGFGTITITGYDADKGIVTYSFKLTDAQTSAHADDVMEKLKLTIGCGFNTDKVTVEGQTEVTVTIYDDMPLLEFGKEGTDDAGAIMPGGSVTLDTGLLLEEGADKMASLQITAINGEELAEFVDYTSTADGVYIFTVTVGGSIITLELNTNTGKTTIKAGEGVEPGDYSFTVTVTDTDGDRSSDTVKFQVEDPEPKISLVMESIVVHESMLDDGTTRNWLNDGTEPTVKGEGALIVEGAYTKLIVTIGGYDIVVETGKPLPVGPAGSPFGTITFTETTDGFKFEFKLTGALEHKAGETLPDTLKFDVTAKAEWGNEQTAKATETGTITVVDDQPLDIAPETGAILNGAEGLYTFDLDLDGKVTDNYGADQDGSVRFADSLDGANSGLTSGGKPIFYVLSEDGQTLYGTLNPDSADLAHDNVFVVTLDSANGTYSVAMNGSVDITGSVDYMSNVYEHTGGNNAWFGFNQPSVSDSPDLLITPIVRGKDAGSVNNSNNNLGIGGGGGGQSVGGEEAMRIDFVTDLAGTPVNGADYDAERARNHMFDGHYDTNGASVTFGKTDGSTVQFVARHDTDGNNVVGDGALRSVTSVIVNGTLISVADGLTQTVNIGGSSYTITFADYVTSDSVLTYAVTISGLKSDDRVATFTDDGYNSLEIHYVSGNSFTITGIGTATTTIDGTADLDLPVVVTDSDGDEAYGNIAVNILPEEPYTYVADGAVSHTLDNTEHHAIGSDGDDVLTGNAYDNVMFGGAGDDTLYGMDGDDTLYGGKGNDILYGGAGDDILIGGAGNDILSGGAGNDTFLWLAEDMPAADDVKFIDTILDFTRGSDTIDLTALGLEAGDITVTKEGNDIRLSFEASTGGTQEILINNLGSGLDTGDAGQNAAQALITEMIHMQQIKLVTG